MYNSKQNSSIIKPWCTNKHLSWNVWVQEGLDKFIVVRQQRPSTQNYLKIKSFATEWFCLYWLFKISWGDQFLKENEAWKLNYIKILAYMKPVLNDNTSRSLRPLSNYRFHLHQLYMVGNVRGLSVYVRSLFSLFSVINGTLNLVD